MNKPTHHRAFSILIALCILVFAAQACTLFDLASEEETSQGAPPSLDPSGTQVQAPTLDTPVASAGEPAPESRSGAARVDIEDFEDEDFDDRWWSFEDDGTASFACERQSPGFESDHTMRLAFETGPDAAAGCGTDVSPDDWARTSGISFMWRASQPGLGVIAVIGVTDPTQTELEGFTPFEAYLQTPGDAWTQVTLSWDDFLKAEWVGESGIDELDLAAAETIYFEVEEGQSGEVWIDDLHLVGESTAAQPPGVESPSAVAVFGDKWALWTNGTQLRGANIYLRIVDEDLDGNEFMGSEYVGPPYTQTDFDRLAELGANYVNISGPGLFTAEPPYVLDEGAQAHLDNTLAMIANADMFAVITVRHGPGRSTYAITGWAPDEYMVNAVWEDAAAQDAYIEMWRYMAERYRDNPIVVGYDLMCEPNAAHLFEIWEPEEFYAQYGGTTYDWNELFPRITTAIRQVDSDTPILVAAEGWSGLRWLPYLQPTGDPRTIYMVHQYEPQDDYTHQELPARNAYPGKLDLDWDGREDNFDRGWLDGFLTGIDRFQQEHGAVVGVNEFGVVRWVQGGELFMADSMALFEARGLNHALWYWAPSWDPWNEDVNEFNFRAGPDPDNTGDTANSLMDTIIEFWRRNTVRPSNYGG